MISKYYPIAVNLKGSLVVVVGGGKIAERKILTLLGAGADIRVISPDLTLKLRRLAETGRVGWLKRKVHNADFRKARLVIAATNNAGVNENVSKWARRRKALVNIVDQARLSDFISPAILTVGRAIIAVYTNGKDPVLSRDLKNFLKEHWDVFLSYRNRL